MNSLVTLKASLCLIRCASLYTIPLAQDRPIHHVPLFTFCLRDNILHLVFLFLVFPSSPSLYHLSGLWEKSAMDMLVWMWLCAVMDASRSRVLSWILKRQMGVETEWDGNAMQL